MAVLPLPPLVIPMASRLIGLLLYQHLGLVAVCSGAIAAVLQDQWLWSRSSVKWFHPG